MSVQTDIEARAAKLTTILEEANAALESKEGQAVETLAELPAAIEALPEGDDSVLSDITVTPTGEEFTETAGDGFGYSSVTVAGDANLLPENIKEGVTVYGVTGELGDQTLRVSAVAAVPESGQFGIQLEDESTVLGTVVFDDAGLPVSLSDDLGSTVTFDSDGWPSSATDSDGRAVTIVKG